MGKGKNYALSIAFIMLFAGIFIMALPYIRQWNFDRKADTLIDDYREWMEEQRDEAMESTGTDTKEKVLYLADLYEAMQEYNREIYENKQEDFRDAWSYQSPSFELSDWGLKENMIGYINIPRMKVNLPIYLGATTENMKKGAVNLSQTSLPLGGENTNCVIAAHRGYSGAAMFREIEKLQIGDEVTVTNLWETLSYKVVETKVILPTDTQEVLIQKGRDLVTLITCHPYRHNYQRYVVYCERLENP